jgi:hypothetical protein
VIALLVIRSSVLFAIFFTLLPGGVLKGFTHEYLCVVKAIQTVNRKFNIADAPVPDPRHVSGEGD